MGKVYRVLDKKLNEDVALKLIKPEITADKETISRFSNELKLARKIAHRNVGKMYELNLVILKCMKKEKEKRFQNAEELLSELDKIEEEIPTTEKVRAHKIIAKDAAKKISWKRVSLTAAVFLLLMIVVAGVYLLTKRESPIDSIAVLPFDSKYADSETEYITDGLTESLIGALSKLPRLKVISRYSVFQYILKKGGEI